MTQNPKAQLNLFPDQEPVKKYTGIISGAIISDCKRYRYQLWRIWNEKLPKVMFLMHNPSTADATEDDPTIGRCIGFAEAWGYGGIYVGNLFPFRATDPDDLKRYPFKIIAPGCNEFHTKQMEQLCDMHILAYGNPAIKGAVPNKWHERWHYLRLTKLGNPWHPLYLSKGLVPIQMSK